MRAFRWLPVLLLGPAGTGILSARADAASQTLMVAAHVGPAVNLTVSAKKITFSYAGSESAAPISAAGNAVDVIVKARTSRQGVVTLTVLAAGDLEGGPDTIDIRKVTWTHTGSGFLSGRLSRTVPQMVGTWIGPGIHTGTLSYSLTPGSNHAPGTYSSTLIYTLTAP